MTSTTPAEAVEAVTESADDAEADTEVAAEEPAPEPTVAPEPSPTPAPSPTPEPTATPQPDLDGDGDPDASDPDDDGDGVNDDEDDFPADAARSRILTTYFPDSSDGGLTLPDTPAVRAFEILHAEWESDETTTEDVATVWSRSSIDRAGEAALIGILDGHRQAGYGDHVVLDVRHVSEYDLRVAIGPADGSAAFDIRLAINPEDGLVGNIIDRPLDISIASLVQPEQQALTMEEAVIGYSNQAETTAVVVAEVSGTECTVLAAHEPSTPIGVSTLATGWLLTAAADAIAAGTLDPAETVTLEPSTLGGVGSISSGVFAEPTEITFQQAVNLMIQRGDAGATDLVFEILGRPAIDEVVAQSAATPDALLPMLSASEVAHLDLTVDGATRTTYAESSDAEQLEFVDETLAPLGPFTSTEQSSAAISAGSSWQSTALDACTNLAGLRARPDSSASAAFIDEALSRSTGYPGIAGAWDRVWHIGGGHPNLNYGQVPGVGVHSLAWLLENEGGPAYVVVAITNSTDLIAITPWILDAFSFVGRIHQLLIEAA